ncbi:MAG: lysophospholipid acyltransferase family protein, partial [Terrimicrobiaceae bacterium]|nr:lysophospholipid acyltransferase family protein [Terrimicrobiaceae bacterium]
MGSGSRKPRKPERAGKLISEAAAWLAWAALAGLVWGLRRLPLEWGFRLGWAAGILLYHLLPGYRRLAQSNIREALGLSRAEASRLARRHFATLGANAASSFKIASLPPGRISEVAEIENLEELRRAIARGRGVVLAINHLGNWELYAQLVYRVPEARFGTVYQAIRNRRIDHLINANRRRLGVLTFDRKKGFAGALALLREPGIVGVLVDQNAGDGGMWTPFFNRLSSTSTLAETLAARAEAAVIPVAVRTVGTARWKVVLEPEIPWRARQRGCLTAAI